MPEPALEVRLFGKVRAASGGAHLSLGLAKVSLLLAYLIINRAQPVARSKAAFTLWPDDEEAAARDNLRRHLHRLQKALPETTRTPWIITTATTLQWNPAAPAFVDLIAFEASLSTGDNAGAVEIYQADLIEDAYDDWIFTERERVRALQAAALDALVAEERTRGDFAAAIGFAKRAAALDPWREDVVRALIVLRSESGDRAGALHEYESFAKRLLAEIGVEPMAETTAVYTAAKQATPSLPQRAAPALNSERELPFVGRVRERQRIVEWIARAKQGRGAFALVAGEAGIGKTRLIAEALGSQAADGVQILRGTEGFGDARPLAAIADALTPFAPVLAAGRIDDVWLQAVAAVIPALRSERDVGEATPLDPARERTRLFEGLLRCLLLAAHDRPTVLILEDLHGASAATIELLEYAAYRIARVPLLILGTYRSDQIAPGHAIVRLRRRMEREGSLAHVALGRLAVNDLEALAAAVVADGAAAARLGAHLCEVSSGNPFFAGELIRAGAHGGVPDSIDRMMHDRLAERSHEARTAAQSAALLGMAFDVETLAAALAWSEDRLAPAIDELLDARFIETASHAGVDYAFSHALMRSAIADAMEDGARVRVHRRIAHVLEARGDDLRAADVAYHLRAAGEDQAAATWFYRAGAQAFAIRALVDASLHLETALTLAGDDDALRYEALVLHESVAHWQGRRQAQLADLEALAALVEPEGGAERRCDLLCRQIAYFHAVADRENEQKAIERLRALAAERQDRAYEARASEALGMLQLERGRYAEAEQALQGALAIAGSIGDERTAIKILCALSEVAALHTRIDTARAVATSARERAAALNDPALVARAMAVETFSVFLANDYVLARELAVPSLRAYQQIGERDGEADALARLGYIEARLFHLDDAFAAYATALQMYKELGNRHREALTLLITGQLYVTIGAFDEAARMIARAEPIVEELDDRYTGAMLELDRTFLAYCTGAYSAARRAAARAQKAAARLGSAQLQATAATYIGLLDVRDAAFDRAREQLERALDLRRSAGQPVDLGFDLALLASVLLAVGRGADALPYAERIVGLDPAALVSEKFPAFILDAAASVLRAAGRAEQAKPIAEGAAALLAERAGSIGREAWRRHFLALPFHRLGGQFVDGAQVSLTS